MKKGFGATVVVALFAMGPAVARDRAPVQVTSPKNMAGLTNLTVGSFSIAFVTEKTDAAFAGSRNMGKANGAITKARLAGMSTADFQAITDAAYEDFVARLRAAGYALGDRAAMVADTHMAKVSYLASGTQGSLTFGKDSEAKALFFGPSAFGPLPLLRGETGNGSGGAAAKMLGGMFGAVKALSGGSPVMAKTYYAVYNKQPLINVLYVIDFADVDRYGGRYAVQATVGLTAALAVVETLSTVTTINAKGGSAAVVIAQPVAVPGNFGSMTDATTSGQRLDNAAGALIGGLFGSGSNSYKHISFTAVPDRYRSGAITAATVSNGLVVAELVSRR